MCRYITRSNGKYVSLNTQEFGKQYISVRKCGSQFTYLCLNIIIYNLISN